MPINTPTPVHRQTLVASMQALAARERRSGSVVSISSQSLAVNKGPHIQVIRTGSAPGHGVLGGYSKARFLKLWISSHSENEWRRRRKIHHRHLGVRFREAVKMAFKYREEARDFKHFWGFRLSAANEVFWWVFWVGPIPTENGIEELLINRGAVLVGEGAEGKILPLKLPFTHMLTNVINTLSANTSWEFIITGAGGKAMRLFGRFPAHPGLTNCQGSLSQHHFKAANCFICYDLDLKHYNHPVQMHILCTLICITQHGAITVTLTGNLWETKLNKSISTLMLLYRIS